MSGAPRPFDPVTGAWLPAPGAAPPWDPEATKRDRWHGLWNALIALDLVTLGLLLGASLTAGSTRDSTASDLAWSAAVTFTLTGGIPFLWVVATRVGGLHGAMHYLRLERPGRSLGWGVLLGIGALALSAALVALLEGAHVPTDNPQLKAFGRVMTPGLAVLLAGTAAVGEEILFRGILQRWLGVWGQAALFGLVHLSYGTVPQVVLPFILGVIFGYAVKRGARLWVPIFAHFTLDIVALLAAMVYAKG